MAAESGQAGLAFGCIGAWEGAATLGSGAWEAAGNSGQAGVASGARAGLESFMLLSRGCPVASEGDHGTWESRLEHLGLVAGVDEGGLSRCRVIWVSMGSGFGK